MNRRVIVKLIMIAVSMALYIVLDRFASISYLNLKITVSALPILIIALLYGPIEALICGCCGAFVTQMLSYGFTITTILWILPLGIRGFLLGSINKVWDLEKNLKVLFISLIIISVLMTLINTVIIYIDSKIYGYYSYVYVFGQFIYRIIVGIISSCIYGVLLPLIIKPLKELK